MINSRRQADPTVDQKMSEQKTGRDDTRKERREMGQIPNRTKSRRCVNRVAHKQGGTENNGGKNGSSQVSGTFKCRDKMICDEAQAGGMHRSYSHQAFVRPIGIISFTVETTTNSIVAIAAQFPRPSGMQRK